MSHIFHLGLAGWPLEHSLSPHLHRAALQACQLPGEYVLYPIPPLPDGQAELVTLLERLSYGKLDGLNVTIPHKQAVLSLLDELSPTAQEVGAANTLYRAGERLVGDNTDVPAFIEDLDQHFTLPDRGEALVLGAGGAARAVVYALSSRNWQVHLAARRPEQAQQLADNFSHLTPAPMALAQPLKKAIKSLVTPHLDLVVNATPLGMQPYQQATPWPEEIPLPSGCRVYDLIYNPSETQLLRQARRQGLPTANGLGMLVYQAALAFSRWTNLPPQELPAIIQAMQAAIYIYP